MTEVLSQNRKAKLILPFKKQTKRVSNLIDKGGDAGVDLAGRCRQAQYDISHKDRLTLKKLDGNILMMGKQIPRTDPIPKPDEHLQLTDNLKAAQQHSKIRYPSNTAFIDLKK